MTLARPPKALSSRLRLGYSEREKNVDDFDHRGKRTKLSTVEKLPAVLSVTVAKSAPIAMCSLTIVKIITTITAEELAASNKVVKYAGLSSQGEFVLIAVESHSNQQGCFSVLERDGQLAIGGVAQW